MVFLEIPNVPKGTVFAEQVTISNPVEYTLLSATYYLNCDILINDTIRILRIIYIGMKGDGIGIY